MSIFNRTFTKETFSTECDAVKLMQQVQACSWCAFKINEIVTLEKCLQQASIEDPKLGMIIEKLANKCVFVEPSRKRKHLTRDDKERRADQNLMKQAEATRCEVNDVIKQIESIQNEIDNLKRHKDEAEQQTNKLRKSILLVEKTFEASQNDVRYQFELVLNSFSRSTQAIQLSIPNYIQRLIDGPLIKQTNNLPKLFSRNLLRLVKSNKFQQMQSQPHLATLFSYYTKQNMIKHLGYYLNSLRCLESELNLIDELYSTEIPYEYGNFSAFKKHIDSLVQPLGRNPPKRVILSHHDVRSLCPLELPQLAADEPVDTSVDSAISDLVNKISRDVKLAVINNGN